MQYLEFEEEMRELQPSLFPPELWVPRQDFVNGLAAVHLFGAQLDDLLAFLRRRAQFEGAAAVDRLIGMLHGLIDRFKKLLKNSYDFALLVVNLRGSAGVLGSFCKIKVSRADFPGSYLRFVLFLKMDLARLVSEVDALASKIFSVYSSAAYGIHEPLLAMVSAGAKPGHKYLDFIGKMIDSLESSAEYELKVVQRHLGTA